MTAEIRKDRPYFVFKICLIGNGGVGKTCIARRLCFDSFDMNTSMTIGIDFYTYDLPVIVDNKETFVRLSLWDFGGQEQFKRLFPYYINGANGIFLIFSLVNMPTLVNLEWWDKQVQDHGCKEVPTIVIGAKSDLLENNDDKHKVDELVVQRFMERYGHDKYYKTSAKDNVNIRRCFEEMTKLILDDHHFDYENI